MSGAFFVGILVDASVLRVTNTIVVTRPGAVARLDRVIQ
jgi:hypothetical protein